MKKLNPNIILVSLAFTVVTLCSAPADAQDSIFRNALSFGAGASFPHSDFAAASFASRAGFAREGMNLDARFTRYGRKGIFGLYAQSGYGYHFFNERQYLAEYDKIFAGDGTTEVTTGGYHFLKAEVGFVVRTVAVFDTRIILQAGTGYSLWRHPRLSATNAYWGTLNTVNADLDLQLSGTVTVRLEHALNRQTGLFLSYHRYTCKPDFRDTDSYQVYTFFLPVRIQNLNLGLTRYF